MVDEQAPYILRAHIHRQDLIDQARRDPNAFMEFAFDKPDGSPSAQGWLHRQWHALADAYTRLMIVAPRGHWKTGQMAVGRPIHELGKNPDHLIKILCQSDAKAVKRLSAVRDHLKNNDRVHAVFPHLNMERAIEWNKHMVTMPRNIVAPDPSIEALGITSSASGDRATLLIADDVVDRRNAISLPKVRDQIREAWDDWVNLLLDEGRIIYICTLWHNADLTHDLMKNPSWAVAWYEINLETLGGYVRLPDGTEWRSDKTPLWGRAADCPHHGKDPRRARKEQGRGVQACTCGPWTRSALQRRKDEFTPRAFARGFSNKPMADEDVKVAPSSIVFTRERVPLASKRYVAIDCASSKKKGADFTGVAVLGLDYPGKRLVVEEGRHFRLNFGQKVALVEELCAAHGPEAVVIELMGGGRELAEWLVENTKLPVIGVRPRGKSKADRLDRITPYLGKVVMFETSLDPKNGIVSEERGDLVGELLSFPIGAHEDIMDAFVYGVRYVTLVHPEMRDWLRERPLADVVADDEETDENDDGRVTTFGEGGRVYLC